MGFGLTGKLSGYYLAQQYQKNGAAGKSSGVSFAELAETKAAGQSDVPRMSFKDMWQARFPGAYYHMADAYKIPQGVWQRYDFPHEKFFSDELDESVIDWKPTGAEPKLTDASVQSRIDSTLGKKAIVVPPVLEEKMENDPALAQQIMTKVESFILHDQATLPPDRIYSCVVVLDENGEIAHAVGSSGGGNLTGPTEAEMRQFEAEQAAKRKRREEYARLNEESALKRKLLEQETEERYYQTSITDMQMNMLVPETVQARFPLQELDGEGNRKEEMYLIAVDKDGIRCSKPGQDEYEWELLFTDESQYEKATEFLNYAGKFMDNFLFAAHENFWEDYLNGNMDVDNFKGFLEGTNNGIPDYSFTVGDSMYIDKEKIQWAQYMNPLGVKFYTAEEMARKQAELIEKNTATAHKLSDPYSILYKKLVDPTYNGERIFREYPGGPLYTADEIMEIMNRNSQDAKYQAGARKQNGE